MILRGLGFETIPYEKLRLGSATVLPVRMHPGLALARIDQGSRRLGYVEAWGRTLNGRRAFVMAPAGRSEFVWIPGSDERDAFALVLAVDQPAELLKALQSLHQPQAAPAAETP